MVWVQGGSKQRPCIYVHNDPGLGREKRASVPHTKKAPRGRMDTPCACWGGTVLTLDSLGTPFVLSLPQGNVSPEPSSPDPHMTKTVVLSV